MKKITLCLLATLFVIPVLLFGQNDFLDVSFGVNGVVTQNYMDSETGGALEADFGTIALQQDGGFITASTFHLHGTNPRYIINRYSKEGVLDLTFGVNAFITDGIQNHVGTLQLQSNQKIIAFISEGDYSSFLSYLVRYNTNGSIDNSFGTNGKIMDALNTRSSLFSVRTDDKILVVKQSGYNGGGASFTLVRYNADGTPDAGFGNNGAIAFSLPSSNIEVYNMTALKDGKIMIRGELRSQVAEDYRTDILLVRLTENGSPDPTFDDDGIKIFNFDDVDSSVHDLVQTDGKIVFLCSSYGLTQATAETQRMIRLNVDGSLDAAFGLGGIKSIEYPILGLQSIQQLENGKLIVSGVYETGENPSPGNNESPAGIVIARYKTNGGLDSAFGQDGYIFTTRESSRALNDKILVQPDGKFLLGSTFCEAWFSCHPHTFVFRYDPERLSNVAFTKNDTFLSYPNPFNQSITLDFNIDEEEMFSVDLYNYDGRKIVSLAKDQNFQAGFNSRQFDIPGTLASGIYFLTVSNAKETKYIRIVKR